LRLRGQFNEERKEYARLIVISLILITLITISLWWHWLDQLSAPIWSAGFVFLLTTVFKHRFDRLRDATLVYDERRAIAAALLGELQAIHERCLRHVDWLKETGDKGYLEWVQGEAAPNHEAMMIVKWPEMYPIYDHPIFDAVCSKIGQFEPSTSQLIAKVYDSILTCERCANRYVNLPVHDLSDRWLPRAIGESTNIVSYIEELVPHLRAVAGLPHTTLPAEPADPMRTSTKPMDVQTQIGVPSGLRPMVQ
jgi:hypothetical protein